MGVDLVWFCLLQMNRLALFGALKMASSSSSCITSATHHFDLVYQGGVKRFPVPEGKSDWSVEWTEYTPVDYTAPAVASGPVWADPEIR